MKTEDIDKKIGMPDVDAEWAKFEREVVDPKTASRKPLYWGIGIASSFALVVGFFLFGHDTEEPQQTMAQQTTTPTLPVVETPDNQTDSIALPIIIDVPVIEPKQQPAEKLIAQAAPSAVTEATVYDCGEVMPQFPGGDRALKDFIKNNLLYPDLAMEYGARGRVIMSFIVDSTGYVSNIRPRKYLLKYDTLYMNRVPAERQVALKEQMQSLIGEEGTRVLNLLPQRWTPGCQFGRPVNVRYNVPIIFNATDSERETYFALRDKALQDRIAGLTIVPTSADLGTGNAMRLGGTRVAGRDSVRIGRKIDYDFLVVVDGQPLSEAEQKQMLSSDIRIYFFNRQQSVDGIYVYKDEDAKRPYVEKYGERAKNAVMVITTAPDTLCDAYVQQHPELMQTRHRIEGYVIDSDTEKPLSDTWINYSYKNVGDTWIKHTDGVGAATDSTGHFVLWPPRKDVKLQATRTGYVTVRIDQPADTTLTIRMTNATIIKDVEVVPKSTIRIRGNE